MKLILSIAVGLVFLMISQLYLNDIFEIGRLNFLGVKDMGTADFSWIGDIVYKLLFVPDLINNFSSSYIIDLTKEYIIFTKQQVFLGITFIFYFTFSFLIALSTNIFHFNKDKRNIVFLTTLCYLLVLYFI